MEEFIFNFGQVVGGWHREKVRKAFLENGLSEKEAEEFTTALKSLVRIIYSADLTTPKTPT